MYYFAYGSNLHPVRLIARVPSAELIGVAKRPNFTLAFHKRSNDGSSKCDMLNSGSELDLVIGAIYKIDPEHRGDLDRFEGKGYGYTDSQITLKHNRSEYHCFTYLAQQPHIDEALRPYHWYKQLVVLGAEYLRFPKTYIASINAVESCEDQNPSRRVENEILIRDIINYH